MRLRETISTHTPGQPLGWASWGCANWFWTFKVIEFFKGIGRSYSNAVEQYLRN